MSMKITDAIKVGDRTTSARKNSELRSALRSVLRNATKGGLAITISEVHTRVIKEIGDVARFDSIYQTQDKACYKDGDITKAANFVAERLTAIRLNDLVYADKPVKIGETVKAFNTTPTTYGIVVQKPQLPGSRA